MRDVDNSIDTENTLAFSVPAPDYAALLDGEPEESSDRFREGYREAAKRGLHLLNQAFWFICAAKNARIAAYQVATALGLQVAAGKTDQQIADELGVTRACISKGRLEFQRANGIKPMQGQKNERARNVYRQKRREKLCRN